VFPVAGARLRQQVCPGNFSRVRREAAARPSRLPCASSRLERCGWKTPTAAQWSQVVGVRNSSNSSNKLTSAENREREHQLLAQDVDRLQSRRIKLRTNVTERERQPSQQRQPHDHHHAPRRAQNHRHPDRTTTGPKKRIAEHRNESQKKERANTQQSTRSELTGVMGGRRIRRRRTPRNRESRSNHHHRDHATQRNKPQGRHDHATLPHQTPRRTTTSHTPNDRGSKDAQAFPPPIRAAATSKCSTKTHQEPTGARGWRGRGFAVIGRTPPTPVAAGTSLPPGATHSMTSTRGDAPLSASCQRRMCSPRFARRRGAGRRSSRRRASARSPARLAQHRCRCR
jgi:hypothetical protein